MNPPPTIFFPCRKPRRKNTRFGHERRAFSLVELLSVIAIIAVLAGILFPVAISVRRAVLAAKTKTQFNQYATAIEQFRIEYGFYPNFGLNSSDADPLIPLRDVADVFIETLSGRKIDGSPADNSYAQAANKQKIPFYRFNESEFASEAVVNCGQTVQKGEIVDAFGNPNIFLVFDGDRNGLIEKKSLPDGNEDLHAAVGFYSSKGGCEEWKTIASWD